MSSEKKRTGGEAKEAAKEAKPLKWWPFAVGIVAVFAAAIALAIALNGLKTPAPEQEEDRPIEIYSEPKIRVAEKTRAPKEFVKGATLEKLTREAEVVALVRIGNWLGESDEDGYTRFAAEVKQVLKGEFKTEKIVLLQDGTSTLSVENYPIFTGGNDLLLFFKKAEEALQNNAGSVYHLIGGPQAVFYTTLLAKDSPRYAVTLDEGWLTRMPHDIPNIADIDEMWKTVFGALAVNDKLWNVLPVNTRMVYSYDLIKSAILSYID